MLPPRPKQAERRRRHSPASDTPVTDHPVTADFKRQELRVNFTAAQASLAHCIRAQARYGITHAITGDATKATLQGEGRIRATRRIPAICPRSTPEQLTAQEVMWTYGQAFWRPA